jgi:hypothetical protein
METHQMKQSEAPHEKNKYAKMGVKRRDKELSKLWDRATALAHHQKPIVEALTETKLAQPASEAKPEPTSLESSARMFNELVHDNARLKAHAERLAEVLAEYHGFIPTPEAKAALAAWEASKQ